MKIIRCKLSYLNHSTTRNNTLAPKMIGRSKSSISHEAENAHSKNSVTELIKIGFGNSIDLSLFLKRLIN